MGFHPGCMLWSKQLRLRRFFRIEPGIEFFWFQDYWHAVMDRVEFFRGLGGQNGEAAHLRTVTIAPPFPKTGENKGPTIHAADPIGLFVPRHLSPFVESVGGDEATPPTIGGPEHRFFRRCFTTGVDLAAAFGGYLTPAWDQTPCHAIQ